MTDRTVTISPDGHAALGNLIRLWATGQAPRPVTVGDFRAQVRSDVVLLGPGFPDDEEIQWLEPEPMSRRLSFVIPAAEDLAAEVPAGSYPLPEFYGQLAFGGASSDVPPDRRDDFRSSRIADYSANRCM
jgi:hypothetical protein